VTCFRRVNFGCRCVRSLIHAPVTLDQVITLLPFIWGVPGLTLGHDTDYTVVFRGFTQSLYNFVDSTVNCATTASFKTHYSLCYWQKPRTITDNAYLQIETSISHVNSVDSHKVYTENLARFRNVNVNLSLFLPSHMFKLGTLWRHMVRFKLRPLYSHRRRHL
jgi:hypothetical protein